MISHEVIPSNDIFPLGWSFDFDYKTSRLVFRKKESGSDSICFFYRKSELKEHLDSQCLTNLEYLEGCEFCSHNIFRLSEIKQTASELIAPRHQYYSIFPF